MHKTKKNDTITTLGNRPIRHRLEKFIRCQAVVGLDKEDLDIQTDGDTLRIKHDKEAIDEVEHLYIQRGIAKRSFDLAWKVASKFDLNKLDAILDKGLLIIDIPYSATKAKQIKIKYSFEN